MRIKNINITNFGAFGEDVTIDFDRYDPNDKILIIGENNDAALNQSHALELLGHARPALARLFWWR